MQIAPNDSMPAAFHEPLYRGLRVALLVPCFNEEAAIAQVILAFREALPQLSIYVFDNSSTDATARIAREHRATVIHVPLRGKGNVVRRMFADVDADVYVMVDGDATYDAQSVRPMIDKLLDEHLDMVVGCRSTAEEHADAAYRRGHQWGNRALTQSVSWIFGGTFKDMLSGYRIFSRRYAKSFPASAKGFEIETELTVHALELRMPYREVSTQYGSRPEGSQSKLSTYKDGFKILHTILKLYVTERPLAFFGLTAVALATISIILGIPLVVEYLEHGLVPRLPTAVLCATFMMMAMLSFSCGLILDTVTRGRQELKRCFYLAVGPTAPRD